MSLMKTLTKVAMGIAVAKGLQHVTSGRGKGGTTSAGTSGLGDMFKDIVGASSGRNSTSRAGQGGAFDDLLGSLSGNGTARNRSTAPSGGGLGDLLGGLSGALGGALGGLGRAGGTKTASSGGGIGDLLGAVLGGGALAGALGGGATPAAADQLTPAQKAEVEDEAEAAVLLKAMIMAVKADGTLDAQEKARLMEAAGEASQAEIDFINRELAAPVDIEALLRDVPRGMEEKVYIASLMAIDLDQPSETAYLQKLAKGLGLAATEVDALHDHLNAKRIYS